MPTRRLLALLLLGCYVLLPAPVRAAGTDPDGLQPASAALVDACFDDYNRLRFAQSESEARQAMALQPELPLPLIYLQASLTAEIQEDATARRDDGAALARFDSATAQALGVEAAWEAAHHDGRSQLYLGTSLGARGLVSMYRGHLFSAYRDGKKAAAALRLAKRRDPGLLDADLGLGQYLYYCGRLSGFLRLILVLHGDVPGGIALLTDCGAGGGRCALLARLVLARILVEEAPDYGRALPYVSEAEERYPENWAYERLALEEARGLGLQRPESRRLVRAVGVQWDRGWRPPDYVQLDPGPLRAQAEALDQAGPGPRPLSGSSSTLSGADASPASAHP
jgi:tetratricopeptide (TPR) repeat protein